MKITASVKKSMHQDQGVCYLHLTIFFYTYTLLICWKKIVLIAVSLNKLDHRPLLTAQLYKLQDYSSVRIGFNMINKCHALPIL